MTTIEYQNRKRGTRLYFTLGASLTIVLVVSMFLFPGPWSVFIYVAAASLAGSALLMFAMGCANIYHRIKMQQIERRRARFADFHHHQNVFDTLNGNLAIPATVPGRAAVVEPEPETESIDFLTVLPHIQTLVVIGAMGSGKTNLLQWVAYRKQQESIVYGIDPHTDQWPAHFVCGNGRDFSSITTLLDDIHTQMDKRYKGQEPKEPVTLIMDEWRTIVENCDNSEPRLKSLLMEGRKANINVFMGSHTDRARQLGLEGAADMREGLTLVYLERNIKTGERKATIKISGEVHPLTIPGEFNLHYQQPELIKYSDKNRICARNGCDNAVTGKQMYCSNACKQKSYRMSKKQDTVTSVTPVT